VTGGKQYKVGEGDLIQVEKLGAQVGETVTFDKLVALSDTTLKVADELAGASVLATVVKHGRDKKIIVYKYKRKSGYHKKQGHRQSYTQLKIDKINVG